MCALAGYSECCAHRHSTICIIEQACAHQIRAASNNSMHLEQDALPWWWGVTQGCSWAAAVASWQARGTGACAAASSWVCSALLSCALPAGAGVAGFPAEGRRRSNQMNWGKGAASAVDITGDLGRTEAFVTQICRSALACCSLQSGSVSPIDMSALHCPWPGISS